MFAFLVRWRSHGVRLGSWSNSWHIKKERNRKQHFCILHFWQRGCSGFCPDVRGIQRSLSLWERNYFRGRNEGTCYCMGPRYANVSTKHWAAARIAYPIHRRHEQQSLKDFCKNKKNLFYFFAKFCQKIPFCKVFGYCYNFCKILTLQYYLFETKMNF